LRVLEGKKFESYFLSFPGGPRLEIMSMPGVSLSGDDVTAQFTGYNHLAMSVGSREQVDALTLRLEQAGHRVLVGPRTTGDGYYESRVLDPDGNRIEITI
jgi:lactoylglutathione lyase